MPANRREERGSADGGTGIMNGSEGVGSAREFGALLIGGKMRWWVGGFVESLGGEM